MLKQIPRFPNYMADKRGNIYSLIDNHRNKRKHPKKLTPGLCNGRYYRVCLHRNSKQYNCSVHHLILETFVSPRPRGMFACHGISGRFCNSLDNLYWATPIQNQLDKYRDGTEQTGERNPKAKLNELQVRIIRRSHCPLIKSSQIDKGIPAGKLARIFSINRSMIWSIVKRKNWKHI